MRVLYKRAVNDPFGQPLKIIHTAASLNPAPGILNQMQLEQEAADRVQLDWTVRCFCPENFVADVSILEHCNTVNTTNANNLFSRAKCFIKFRKEYYKWLRSQEKEFDAFVLRHYTNDPLQYRFVRDCQKPVFLVHHTLEIPELWTSGLLALPRVILEKHFGKKSIIASSCIIGVTDEIIKYELKRTKNKQNNSLLYPNGILLNKKELLDRQITEPELIFVAGYFAPWQGLDLLLDSIEQSNESFVLHLVGEMDNESYRRAKKDKRIVIHGLLSKDEINNLSQKCCLGLSSFGLFRKSMKQACTLKVREYLSLGLPVYADYQDIFPPSFPFFKIGPAKIESVLDYAKSVSSTDRNEIARASQPFIDKESLLLKLYEDIVKLAV